jgi:hypothetical protein
LISGVVLLHYKGNPNTAVRTGALLKHLNWELFDYPYYSISTWSCLTTLSLALIGPIAVTTCLPEELVEITIPSTIMSN